jgi:hypothetical protein
LPFFQHFPRFSRLMSARRFINCNVINHILRTVKFTFPAYINAPFCRCSQPSGHTSHSREMLPLPVNICARPGIFLSPFEQVGLLSWPTSKPCRTLSGRVSSATAAANVIILWRLPAARAMAGPPRCLAGSKAILRTLRRAHSRARAGFSLPSKLLNWHAFERSCGDARHRSGAVLAQYTESI